MVTDEFMYTVAVTQLRNCKSNKELEMLVRKYVEWYEKAKNIAHVYPYTKKADYKSIKYNYKLFILALTLFTNKSKAQLPKYIYQTDKTAQHNFIDGVINNSKTYAPLLEYSEFIDLFEFTAIVETSCYITDYAIPLHNIILDRPLPFKIKFNQQLSFFDKYSTIGIDNVTIQQYLYALRLKQTLSPNQPATILDQYVADTFAAIEKHQDISKHITLLEQHIEALKTYQEALDGKLQ